MIAGVASYVPDDILTNEELSKMVDTTDEWITTRVGIKTRHILKGEGLGSSKMGSRAVKKYSVKPILPPEKSKQSSALRLHPTTVSPLPHRSSPEKPVSTMHSATIYKPPVRVLSLHYRPLPLIYAAVCVKR